MDSTVSHVPLDAGGADEVWEFCQEGIDSETGIEYLDTGNPRAGSLGGCRERCDGIQEPVVATVHQEFVVG
jgi:hypothetical protein